MTQQLSPAAQAVLDAFISDAEDTGLQMDDMRENVAAALRVAADQMRYEDRLGWTGYGYYTDFQNQIRVIADELEALPE